MAYFRLDINFPVAECFASWQLWLFIICILAGQPSTPSHSQSRHRLNAGEARAHTHCITLTCSHLQVSYDLAHYRRRELNFTGVSELATSIILNIKQTTRINRPSLPHLFPLHDRRGQQMFHIRKSSPALAAATMSPLRIFSTSSRTAMTLTLPHPFLQLPYKQVPSSLRRPT